ncbi:SMC family ATPase [Leifsonia kafniensis]|uniref:Nuclease SbcCD subunit C n=1 Tax=Leifsonia kafniensis TaxID=475957 RepID=A0ABP7L8U0_9MICO
MKIKRLRIAGFGPYKDEQLIDFERFDDDGIFLITGKTGAGKSSILDAICFALYASVPRYDGTESQLRSDHCEPDDPTFVELEFAMGETDYRIYRTPRYDRAKKRGGGTTTSQPDARLDVRDDSAASPATSPAASHAAPSATAHGDGWRGIAARPVDVGLELSRILPLKQDQFLQVILLAQNRFQKFLLAKTDDRRAVLRTLFGTARFERFESELLARRKVLGEQISTLQQQIGGFASTIAHQLEHESPPDSPTREWFETVEAELAAECVVATATAVAADAAFATASDDLQLRTILRSRQERRDAARLTHESLESRRAEIDDLRARSADAQRAARVMPQIRALAEAESARARALANEAAARELWLQLGESPERVSPAGLQSTIDEIVGLQGSLHDVLAAEKLVPALDHDVDVAETRLAEHSEALARVQTALAELPGRVDTATAQRAEAALAAAREAEARAELARLDREGVAADTVRRLEPVLERAQQSEKTASAANRAAATAYDDLLDRRLAGHAAELAADLVDGQGCAVCGSTAHPAPATRTALPVGEQDIELARAAQVDAQSALDAAHEVVQSTALALAEARTRANDKTPEQWNAEHEGALATLEQALAARDDVARLERRLVTLRAELALAHTELVDVQATRDAASALVTTLRSQRATIVARVADHRGEFETVTKRVARLQSELDAARRILDADTLCDQRQVAHELAVSELNAQLHLEGFADQEAVRAARVSDDDIAEQHDILRRYDDELAVVKSILQEPGIAELATTLVDVEAARGAANAAAVERDKARSIASTLLERARQIGALVADAIAQFDASDTLLHTQTQVRELAAVVHGDEPNTKRMRLETYVLAAQLEEIIAAANQRLRTMTGGRYLLEHDDSLQFRGAQSGLGLAIRDAHTGRARPTHSLSGGETFLASLALALGLAEVVSQQAGGIALDTLFVDEGFGSLDAETLETAMSTLDSLRTRGRTIGLISHVDSMKEQIPAKLAIVVSERGDSSIVV